MEPRRIGQLELRRAGAGFRLGQAASAADLAQGDRRWNDSDLSENYKMDAAYVSIYAFLLALRVASNREIRAAEGLVDGCKAHT